MSSSEDTSPLFDLPVLPAYPGRVYFGLSECRERLKIGLTRRGNGHRGGELHFSELVSVPGGREIEAAYHRIYAAARIGHSEWFYLTDALLIDVLVMCIQRKSEKSVEILKAILRERLDQKKVAA